VTGFLLRRFAASLLLLWLVLSVVFCLVHIAPGNAADSLLENSRIVSPEQRQALVHALGLDRPLYEQYFLWLGKVVRGDWGTSFSQQRPVTVAIAEALPATLLLTVAALLVEYAFSLLLGIAAARRPGTVLDHAIRVVSLVFNSQPPFWLGLMAILLFAYVWPVMPSGQLHSVDAEQMSPLGRWLDLARHLVLPALVLGLFSAGSTVRFVRASLLDVLHQDYVRTARAKGLSERRVLWVHALRNALTPVIQIFALTLPTLLNGSLVTETVFALPGLGRLTFSAILGRDIPLILGTTAFAGVLVVLANLLADILQALADPRVRDADA
jgi:peptide/nickel transport system permease protein